MAIGGAKFAQRISPKAENYYKQKCILPKLLQGLKKGKNNKISKNLSRAVNVTILIALLSEWNPLK